MMSLNSLVLCLLLATGINAGGGGGGGGDQGQWFTTTCWETKWKSAATEYVTLWQTQWQKPDDFTDISLTTATIYNTVNHYFTNTATETKVEVSHETTTATATATSVTTATVISASVVVTTKLSTITDTVTEFPVCTTTTPLVGLVLCPTRVINPTYTPPTALPTDWLWGCPPDTLCTPKQIDCNFEPNLPADTYVCSPEDCKPVVPLPQLDTSWDSHNCTPYIPPPGYANLAPPIFDLGYDIFQFNGQPGPYCPPPPSTTWEDWTSLPPPPPATSAWADWVSQPPAPAPPPASSWADWSNPPSEGAHDSPWGDWNGNGGHGQGPRPTQTWAPAAPGITPRAVLAARQDDAPDYEVPAACYNPCNAAVLNAQNCGLKGATLCPVTGAFSQQYTNCGNCISVNKDKAYTEPPRLISSLVTFLDYCSGWVATQAASTSTTAAKTTLASSSSSSTSLVSAQAVSVSPTLSAEISISTTGGAASALGGSKLGLLAALMALSFLVNV